MHRRALLALPAALPVLSFAATGTGARGAVNDVGLVFPPGGRAPWVVAALQSGSAASTDALSAVVADAMQQLVKAWS